MIKTLAVVFLAAFVAVGYANPTFEDFFDQPDGDLPYGMKKLYKVNVTRGDGQIETREVRADASWSVCGGDKSIIIHKLKIPSPIRIPGANPIEFDVELLRDFDNFAIDVLIERRVGLWINIPCISNLGSCFYDDICAIAAEGDSTIIQALAQAGLDICPFKQKRIAAATTINIPSLPSAIGSLVSGKYRITAKLYQHPVSSIKVQHLCVKIEVEIK